MVSATDEIKMAIGIANDYLVLFGIPPTHPNTGYGYIAQGAPLASGYRVLEFKEKPDLATAEQYLVSGYLWNSGMFLFSTKIFFEELARYQPEFLQAFKGDAPDYEALPSLSIDYGLLEKSKHVAVVPLEAPWTDLGTFQAWYEVPAIMILPGIPVKLNTSIHRVILSLHRGGKSHCLV